MWILFDRSISSESDVDRSCATWGLAGDTMPYALDRIIREIEEIEDDSPGSRDDAVS